MKKIDMMGMCLMANALICLATIAHGQQPAAQQEEELYAPTTAASAQPGQTGPQQPAELQQPGNSANLQRGAGDPAPTSDEWPMPSGPSLTMPERQAGDQRTTAGGQPGELGVWLAATGGAGVQIRRVTEGGAADKAGLQPGDVILQVNGRGASMPQAVAQMIRQIPAGQAANVEIWRNGSTSDLQITLEPIREQHEVGFRGESSGRPSGDLASRTMKLEEQLAMVMRELRQLREEMAQLRTGASSQPTNIGEPALEPGFDAFDQPAAQPSTTESEPSTPTTAAPAEAATQEDPFADTTTEPAAEPAAEPATEPATEEDPFGSATTEETTEEAAPAETEPATEEAAPAETESETAEESDSLFE